MDRRPRSNGSPRLYNSSTKLQSFFGIDDPNELQTAKSEIRTHKQQRRIFNKGRSSGRKSRIVKHSSSKSANISAATKRRSSSKKSSKRSSLFRAFRISMNSTETQTPKIRWRPSLRIIYDDAVVLAALTAYMERSFNAENVSFLIAVRALLDVDEEHIDSAIKSIYDCYIGLDATSPVNLSYETLMQILWQRGQLSTYDVTAKRALFVVCVSEIEQLMLSSVLPAFYESADFAAAAPKSDQYASFRRHAKNRRNKRKYESLESPLSSPSPPIKLEISHSAMSYFHFDGELSQSP